MFGVQRECKSKMDIFQRLIAAECPARPFGYHQGEKLKFSSSRDWFYIKVETR